MHPVEILIFRKSTYVGEGEANAKKMKNFDFCGIVVQKKHKLDKVPLYVTDGTMTIRG